MLMMRGPRGRDRPQLTPMMRDAWGPDRQQLTPLMRVMRRPWARVLIGELADGLHRPQPTPNAADTLLLGPADAAWCSDQICQPLTRLMLLILGPHPHIARRRPSLC